MKITAQTQDKCFSPPRQICCHFQRGYFSYAVEFTTWWLTFALISRISRQSQIFFFLVLRKLRWSGISPKSKARGYGHMIVVIFFFPIIVHMPRSHPVNSSGFRMRLKGMTTTGSNRGRYLQCFLMNAYTLDAAAAGVTVWKRPWFTVKRW